MDARQVTNAQSQLACTPLCTRLTGQARLLVWATATTILLAGCGGVSGKTSAPTPTSSASAPQARTTENCTQLLESSPQTTGADPPLVSKVAGDGSLKLVLPADLVASTSLQGGYVIRFQAGSGIYPAYGVRLFHHTGKVPDSWALSNSEAHSTEKTTPGVVLPVVVAIPMSLKAAAPGTAGRIDICLGPGSGWPNPWTVVIQWLIPIADGPNAWKEYVIEAVTTVDRYGTDAPIASTVANSLRLLT